MYIIHCPACGAEYEKGEKHSCGKTIGIAAVEWVKCNKCKTRYPRGTEHSCSGN